MRRTRIVFIVLLFLLVLAFNSSIFSNDLTDAELITWESVNKPFFNKYNPFGAGARAIGMGEAFTAIADDASAVYYNPAGLAQLDHNELEWTGGSYFKSAPFTGFASFVMALGNQYFGLSYSRLYHPIGRYPSVIGIPGAGVNTGTGSLFNGEADPTLSINPGIYPWYGIAGLTAAQQAFLAEKYREIINRSFQEDQVYLTYATPLTGDRSFMFGINVKYEYIDAEALNYYKNSFTTNGKDLESWAWALDAGFLYKLRIIEFLKDFNIGIMLRDVSGRVKYPTTGAETSLYFTSSIGISMRTTQLIEKETTSFSVDWDAVNDPAVLQSEKNRLRFGGEQWFMDNHFAIRLGLVDFMYAGPWRASVGASAKYWFGIDYAYVFGLPFGEQAEEEGDSHWISLNWSWGQVKRALPTPDVFASVDPISFAPKNGEVAMFKLGASSPAGIDRWALNILDKNNNLVKTYVDIGTPPSQIAWNGTDAKYQLLPDAEYSFVFEATDKLGSTSSTPLQTVKIFTPVLEAVNKDALNRLKQLLNKLKDDEIREDNSVMAQAKTDLAALKKQKAKPTPVPPPAPNSMLENPLANALAGTMAGNSPARVSGAAGTGAAGPASIIGFPNVDSGAIRSAYIQTMPDGSRMFNMEYITENTLPQYALKEMALMVRSVSESLGYSVDSVGVNALYGGNNNLDLVVPSAQAQNYSKGLISAEQMIRGSNITLNGEAINPNF